MKILAIFYTHNQTSPKLMEQVVKHIQQAADYSNLNYGVKGDTKVELVACPWHPIPDWKAEQHLSFLKGGAPGHLNIASQILRVLYEKCGLFTLRARDNYKENTGPAMVADNAYDLIVQLEHDVLYAANYFERITATYKQALETKADPAKGFVQERWITLWDGVKPLDGISCLDYIGMNESGYLRVKERHEPLSMMAMRPSYAIKNYERALRECIVQGWCYLEPDDKSGFAHIPFLDKTPNVHVNMNHTEHNHHFTNHHSVCYADYSNGVVEREYWGDFSQYEIFKQA